MDGSPGPRSGRSLHPTPLATTISRRRFLALAGGTVAYVALRPGTSLARRLERPDVPLQAWVLPPQVTGANPDVARWLVGAAILAPSHWNTQPWRFESEQRVIRLVADATRALPLQDPDQRNLHLSLGAALENLLVAARAWGLQPSVTYLPHGGAQGVVAEVAWTPGNTRRDRPLFEAIVDRRTNRREYDGRGIYAQNRAQLTAQMPDDVRLHWIDDPDRIRGLADLAHDAVHRRVSDHAVERERYAWTRFGDDEARRHADGIDVDHLELNGLAHWFAGRYFSPRSMFLRFGAESAAKQARSQVRSAGALALITVPGTAPASWIAAGQAYERLALTATSLGIAQQPIGEPLELDATRGRLVDAFGAAGEQPVMFVRLGHALPPEPSMRRSLLLVASFKTT